MDEIKKLLENAFPCCRLEIKDESHKHKGHKEAVAHGGGHYFVKIEAPAFKGKTPVEQQRMVYQALQPEFSKGKIHALKLRTAAKA